MEEVWELQKERANRVNNVIIACLGPRIGIEIQLRSTTENARRQRESYGNSPRVGFKFG